MAVKLLLAAILGALPAWAGPIDMKWVAISDPIPLSDVAKTTPTIVINQTTGLVTFKNFTTTDGSSNYILNDSSFSFSAGLVPPLSVVPSSCTETMKTSVGDWYGQNVLIEWIK